MSNFAEDIERAADGEVIEQAVIGQMGWGDYGKEHVPGYDEIPQGQLLPWKEARKFLDFEYDSGFGAPGCPAIYAWTPTKVLFVVQYDGSTWVTMVPRHPKDLMPEMPGG
jgi:hypothetical protein